MLSRELALPQIEDGTFCTRRIRQAQQVTRPGLWPALLQPALLRLQIFLQPQHNPQQPNSGQVLHASGVASSPSHAITYPEHSAEVYSSTAFVLFSPRSLHIQQSYQSVFQRYLGKLRMCRDAPPWIDLQRWWQYSQKACLKCAHDNEARRSDHTLLPLQHTVSHSFHSRELAPRHPHLADRKYYPAEQHRPSRRHIPFQHTACTVPHCPVATRIVPTAKHCTHRTSRRPRWLRSE